MADLLQILSLNGQDGVVELEQDGQRGPLAIVKINRPEARNAQNRGMLVELNDAFLRAEADDTVRVVILGGTGPMFSSGHDMGSKVAMEEFQSHPTRAGYGGTRSASESTVAPCSSVWVT